MLQQLHLQKDLLDSRVVEFVLDQTGLAVALTVLPDRMEIAEGFAQVAEQRRG